METISLINYCSFYADIVFSREKENNSLNLFRSSLRIYSMTCHLYDADTFSTIFNIIRPFKNLDTNSSVQFSVIPSLFDLKNNT